MKAFYRFVCVWLALSLLASTAGPALAAPGLVPPLQTATVEPASLSLALQLEESATETIVVTTAPTPIPKVDVLFLFDVTGSMSGVLETAKDQGISIMNALRAQVPDSAFGVASFADYQDYYDYAGYGAHYGASSDYPWSLDADITTDIETVQQGIESLNLLDGEDAPEAYSRALFEALYIDWRPATKHIVVLFGDSIPHDPNFFSSYGENSGVDPGVDTVAGTPDDLYFADVVAQVKDRGIEVIPVNSDLDRIDFVQAGFEYVATETGGRVYLLENVEDLPEVVAAGLTEATSVISSLFVTPDPGYEGWVQLSPTAHPDVGGGETRTFEVVITVPPDASLGEHSFNLTVAGDHAALGATAVNVLVGGMSLDPAAIRTNKRRLVQDLSRPKFETEFLKARFVWSPDPDDTYADEEQMVETWLNSLDWGNLAPSELAAVHCVTVQEQGLWDLMQSQAKTSHIGNTQLAHSVGLIFSLISIVKFLDRLEGKHIVGRLVTKLRNYVDSKLLGLSVTVILWLTDHLPPNPSLEFFRAEIKVMGETLQEHLENALKGETLTEDLLKKLLKEVMAYPLDQVANKIYVQRTEGLVSQGLSMAEKTALGNATMDEVRAQATHVTKRSAGEVGAVTSQRQTIEQVAEQVEATQDMLSVASQVASTASTILTLTGLGALPAQIGHAVSLVLKIVDAVMSVSLGYVSYSAWWSTPDVAASLTSLSFASDLTSPTLTAVEQLPPLSPEQALAYTVMSDVRPAPVLSDYTLSQLARVDADVATYGDLLDRLAAAVRAGEIEAAESLAEQLLDADQALSDTFLIARQPVFAGARSALNSSGAAFELAYSGFGRGAASFDGEGAILYVYLLGWFYDPANAENQALLLDQIETVKSSTENYQTALEVALPYVESKATQPSVLVTDHTLPDLSVGMAATLQIEIFNPTPNTAEDVIVTFDPGQGARVISQGSLSLGALAGETSTTVEFQFVPTGKEGLLSVSTSTVNGSGTFRIIPFTAAAGVRGGGLGIAIILLVLAVGAVSIVVISHRRRMAWSTAPVVAPAVTRAQLQGVAGEWAGRTIAIASSGLTIGRSRDSDVRLEESSVSRRHAAVRSAYGRFFLQDQGSTIGTFVNGQRVNATALNNGDRIRIGLTEFEFRVG